MRAGRIDKHLNTVWAIAASPFVNEFMIGYTSRAGYDRLREHSYNYSYQHLVILADRLNREDAHQLERSLQEAIKEDRRRLLYRKYCGDRRDGRYYKSAGQGTADPLQRVHSVYMTWWEEV